MWPVVRVRLYGSLRATAGRDELYMSAENLKVLLELLGSMYPELGKLLNSEGFIVLVNDMPVAVSRFDMKLDEEARVDILPVVSGGASMRL